MNIHALLHIPQSAYAFPVDRNKTALRLRAARGDVKKADVVVHRKYDDKRIGAQNMRLCFSDEDFDYFQTDIATDRGRRLYYFDIEGKNGERLLYTENGAQKPEAVPSGYFPFFQIPFLSESDVHVVPDKFRGAVIYQIFPDRFFTRNPQKDFSSKPSAWDIFGGELCGAAEKLDYIKSLGANTVYVTPINPAHTNHHYDVEDYYRVSDDFGGDEAFKAFTDRAHQLGMSVILDGVFNHCSYFNPVFQDVVKNGGGSKYYDWFTIDGDKPDLKKCNYQTFANGVGYMPKFNCDNPEVVRFVCDVAKFWIDKFKIDAWRLDVADDVAPALWRSVRSAVKSADKNAIMIGESWRDSHSTLGGDVFDGVMNYGFTRAVRDYLAYRACGAAGAATRLIRTYMQYPRPAANLMMNLIGGHDTHRFYSLCDEDLFNFQCALAIMFFYDGMPTVYYGDEIPLSGYADPDCRRGFDWSRTGSPTAQLITKLARIRTDDKYSEMTAIYAEGDTLVMERRGDKSAKLCVNITANDGLVAARTMTVEFGGEKFTHKA